MSSALLAATHSTLTAPDVSVGHLLFQMVVALVIVVGAIWGIGKVWKRWGSSRAAGPRVSRRTAARTRGTIASFSGARGRVLQAFTRERVPDTGLQILSRQPIGKGKMLAVVEVGTQQFLVGVSDSGLTPLGELRADQSATPADLDDSVVIDPDLALAAAGYAGPLRAAEPRAAEPQTTEPSTRQVDQEPIGADATPLMPRSTLRHAPQVPEKAPTSAGGQAGSGLAARRSSTTIPRLAARRRAVPGRAPARVGATPSHPAPAREWLDMLRDASARR